MGTLYEKATQLESYVGERAPYLGATMFTDLLGHAMQVVDDRLDTQRADSLGWPCRVLDPRA